MNNKIILFDFDGTIADSSTVILKVANQFAEKFGYKKVDDIDKFRNKGISELFKEFQVPLIKLPFFLVQYRKEYRKEIANVTPIIGIPSALKNIKREGYKFGIITSNSRKNVIIFLEKFKLNFFDYIYADIGFFRKSGAIKKCLKRNKIDSSKVLLIGDETRDIEAARKNGIKVIAVTWGMQSKEMLKKFYPDCIVDSSQDLLKTIRSLRF